MAENGLIKCSHLNCKSEVIKTELHKTFRLRLRRCLKCYECFYTQEILFEVQKEKLIDLYESEKFKERNELNNKLR